MPRPSELAEAPGTGLGGQATLWVDVSDLLGFLSHHSVVSGIQRVLVESIPFLQSGLQCRFVALDEIRGRLVQIDQAELDAVLADVRAGIGDPPGKVLAIRRGLGGCQPVHGGPGDVVAVLGAGWMFPGLFAAVQRVKDEGAAVVVLLYDLIPVVFPGYPEPSIEQFRAFLLRVSMLADRAPAISRATRRDFEDYCEARGWPVPGGSATRLAGNQWSGDRVRELGVDAAPAWPRPFVLFVSTVEIRKNHVLALRAWARLIERHGADEVPDLVCVGRLGWNANDFLEAHRATRGLGGRIHLLTDSLPDAQLAALYRDSMFTIYPSRYEGWGLPIAESLDMGKPAIAARNTSLEEAGGDLVRYFEDNDLDGFVAEIDRYLMEPAALAEDARRITTEHRPLGWAEVATALIDEVRAAQEARRPIDRTVGLGIEYGVTPHRPYRGGPSGTEYLHYLETQRRLPLTGQVQEQERAVRAGLLVDTTVAGNARQSTMVFARPSDAELVVVLAVAPARASGRISVNGPSGVPPVRRGRGGVFAVPVGAGILDEDVLVVVHGRVGIRRTAPLRSFVVLDDPAIVEAMLSAGPVAKTRRPGLPVVTRGRRALAGRVPRLAGQVRRRMWR